MKRRSAWDIAKKYQANKKPRTLTYKPSTKANYSKGREHLGAPKSELKAIDYAQTTLAFDQGGNQICVNAPKLGSDVFNRIGRKLYMKSLHVVGYVNNAATIASPTFGNLYVIYDNQPNGALPAISDIFQDSNTAAGTTATSPANINNRERFKILRHKRFLLAPATNTAGVITNFQMLDYHNPFSVDEFIKLKGLESTYNATNGGTIADLTSGSLIIGTYSDTAGDDWNITLQARLRFYD